MKFMHFIKLLSLNLILYSSLFCEKEIGKYKIIKIDEYQGSLSDEEISLYRQEGLVIICDTTGKIANFKGNETEKNVYFCEEADGLVKLMSVEDKQKTYLRKFNGFIQLWKVNA